MSENLVKIYEYELSREIVDKCIEEERKITSKDVEMVLHEIFKENNIKYKNRLTERWTGIKYSLKYHVIVEIYVEESDATVAKKIIEESINN